VLVRDQEGVVAAPARELIDALDEMRHGHTMRMLRVGVAVDQVRLRDSAQDDPAAGVDQALEHAGIDADSRPHELLHGCEVGFAMEDPVPM
jgi:hypothetical protein